MDPVSPCKWVCPPANHHCGSGNEPRNTRTTRKGKWRWLLTVYPEPMESPAKLHQSATPNPGRCPRLITLLAFPSFFVSFVYFVVPPSDAELTKPRRNVIHPGIGVVSTELPWELRPPSRMRMASPELHGDRPSPVRIAGLNHERSAHGT